MNQPAISGYIKNAHLRIARPTDQLNSMIEFYSQVLGFQLLGSFEDHDGFDGAILGHRESGYHLEFTSESEVPAGGAPSGEHLLVFYIPDPEEWQSMVEHIESCDVAPVPSHNPYWDQAGRTYVDPDGYRFVIQNASWPST